MTKRLRIGLGARRLKGPSPSRYRRWALRRLFDIARQHSGVAMIEFALVLPLLTFAMFGIFAFGSALSNYVDLTEGVRATSRVLAQASAYPTQAYNNAQTYFAAATANLTQADLTLTITVNGTVCNSASACDAALAASTGDPVTVSATYSICIEAMGFNFLPSCSLTATTTQMIE